MDAQQTKSPSLVTDLQINLRICQHAFKFLPDIVSAKNSWDTLTKRCFFPSRAPLVPLKVVYRGSATKSCTPTLRGQGDPRVSQPFWLRLQLFNTDFRYTHFKWEYSIQLAHEMFFWFHLIVFWKWSYLAAVGFDPDKLLVLATFSWLGPGFLPHHCLTRALE